MEHQPANRPRGEPITLRLGPFNRHGTTRARHGGRTIEVEHGIPDEVVRVDVVGKQRPRGRIISILEADTDRVSPACAYFRDWSCGGCQWQHIDYQGQLERKRLAVNRTMSRAGLKLTVDAAHYLDDPWRYRSTAGISLGRRAGFRRQASLAIVPIRDCPISHPLIGELMAALNDLLDTGSLPDFRGRVRVDVRVSERDETAYLLVLVRPDDRQVIAVQLDTLVETLTRLPCIGGVSIRQPDGAVEVISGEFFGAVTIDGRSLTVSAASFLQTNLRLMPDLIGRLREEALPLEGKRVADVYGGIGALGLFVASEAAEVVVIERDHIAIQAGEKTARDWGLENVRFTAGSAEDVIGSEGRFDVIIVDPPRSGLGARALAALIRKSPPVLLYVSCLAESLGHDLAVLTGAGFRVEGLELFDFYPQTYHVELLAILRS